MSEPEPDALRRVIEAFQDRDWDRMRTLLPAEFEYHTSDDFPEGATVYRGPDAMMRVREFLDEMWTEADVGLVEAEPVGDAVLATMSGSLRTERIGQALLYTFFQVWRFDEGRPVSAWSFQDRAGALRSLGRPED
jgi:ketosteroid isomerase-like protein